MPPKTYNGKNHTARVTRSADGERQGFYARRKDGIHEAADFNYHYPSGAPVGQNGVNMTNPNVRSPASGTVTKIDRDRFGAIEIRDNQGNTHRLMHLKELNPALKKGSRVFAGLEIGAMGGRGPAGANQFDQHVHYSVKRPDGTAIDPERHWNDKAGRPYSLTGTKTIDSSRAETLDPAAQQDI